MLPIEALLKDTLKLTGIAGRRSTGHVRSSTHFSGYRVNQDLKAPVSHKLLLK